MTEWEKKHQNTAESDRKREIDDFWDVDKLLPERPARRTPPPPRPAPTAVEIELTPQKTAEPVGEVSLPKASEPVTAAPLTVFAREEGSTQSAGEYGRPMPAPQLAPNPNPNPDPRPAVQGEAEATRYVPAYKRSESKPAEPLREYRPHGVLLHSVKVYG